MSEAELIKKAAAIGRRIARRIFDARSGNRQRNVEVHVHERELAEMIALGALNGWQRRPEDITEEG